MNNQEDWQDALAQYPEASALKYPMGTWLHVNEDKVTKNEVASVLNRLKEYYSGRMRAVIGAMAKCEDADLAFSYATDATRWKAKRDAVCKVAENLEITLRDD